MKTHTAAVRKARRHVLDLMLANHYGECYACGRNNNCELQALAQEYGVDFFRFGRPEKPRYEIDASSHAVVRDMNKCVLCRRCVRTCIDLQEVGVLEAINRGDRIKIATFCDKPLAEVICINCGQCINRCPTGALGANDMTDEVWDAIDDPAKHVVIQTAPSPRAGIGECFGLGAGPQPHLPDEHRPAPLRLRPGVRHQLRRRPDHSRRRNGAAAAASPGSDSEGGGGPVFHIVANPSPLVPSPFPVHQLLARLGQVRRALLSRFLGNLSTAKSPQQMFGAVLKTFYAQQAGLDPENIVTVALMPCSAKKFECNRPEMCASGYKDIDYGLTTRELAKMIREAGVDLPNMPKSDFDDPFGSATGSGVIFGATGGVMEAAVRTVLELVTGQKIENLFDHAEVIPLRGFDGIRYAELPITEVGPVPPLVAHLFPDWNWLKGVTLKVAVAHGTANAKRVMQDIKAGGPAQPVPLHRVHGLPRRMLGRRRAADPHQPAIRAARAKAIYDEDRSYSIRKSHENPALLRLYAEFLTDGPCGHRSHELLHTHVHAAGEVYRIAGGAG